MMRVGVGFDMHRLVPGRPLVLGGVAIPCDRGLEGDSDADVLTHAILDALLGAAGAGDIGSHFGVGRPEMTGISSLVLLRRTTDIIAGRGYRPGNVDATIVAEAPRIGPHVAAMREKLADVLKLPQEAVNVKGTTAKGLGALGAGEGIAAFAVATVVPLESREPRAESREPRA